MTTRTTWTAATAACRELGFTLKRTGHGSERALYKVGTARPMEDGATYYTDDAQDAVDTATAMKRREDDAAVTLWVTSKGTPKRGSMQPIKHYRQLVGFWLTRAHKIDAHQVIRMTEEQLAAVWHDTTNAALAAMKGA